MHRFVFVLVLVLLGSPLTAGRAAAYDQWCADDPVVSIDGRLLDIQVQMPVDMVTTMRSTTLTVIIPRNVIGFVVVDDVSAFPMETTVVAGGPAWDRKGPLPITIVVDVLASTDYPIRVVATPLLDPTTPQAPSTTATGTANTRLELKMLLGS